MKKQHAVMISLVIIFGGIFVSDVFGLWQTESTKIPMLTLTGEFDPGDIRGSYTLGDINNNFDVEPSYLAEAFGIESDTPEDFAVKQLESLYSGLNSYYDQEELEIGTASVRYFVHLITGIESELITETYLPKKGLEMLIRDGYINASHPAVNWAVDLSVTLIPTDEVHTEPIVKGNTTVQDLLNLGFEQSVIEALLLTSSFNRNDVIKDLCFSNGLTFSDIKVEFLDYYEEHLLE